MEARQGSRVQINEGSRAYNMQEFRFVPTVEFTWFREDVNKLVGVYHPGASYNCTREPRHDKLREMCDQWEAEGKIVKIPVAQQFDIVRIIK